MFARLARGTLLALIVVTVVGVPALAIRSSDRGLDARADVHNAQRGQHGRGQTAVSRDRGGALGHERARGLGRALGHAKGEGEDRAHGDTEGERGGPPSGRRGGGPPHGLAWGFWLQHDGGKACERIAARLEAHPAIDVPAGLRAKVTNRLGCDLGD